MITRNFDIELSKKEELMIVRKWCIENRLVIEILLKDEFNGQCPFPEACSAFPRPEESQNKRKKMQRYCGTLTCNADVCSNGCAYRMS